MNNRRFVETIAESAANYPYITFSGRGAIYTCVNPFSYHLIRGKKDLYERFDGIFVDGILMCKFINLLWRRSIPRLSFDMSGMAVDLFSRLNDNNETIYFIGAKQDSIDASIKQIKKSYPRINIIGYRNGYFESAGERQKVIDNIIRISPDFIIVGMGSPLQEQFCIDLKNAGYNGIAFTCGGFLHQTSTGIHYYPDWINRYNLRAFYRLYKEKGLWKRLYNVLIEFPILFTWDSITTICRRQ